MYSVDCGLLDSRTHGLVDSHRKYLQLEYFVLCRHTAWVSLRVHESAEYMRLNWWASILSYIEGPYIHHLIYIGFASGVVKIT